jgi:hypothetical protein
MLYVLKKNGMYYAHDNCGYVNRVLMAEIYTKKYAKNYAKNHDEIDAIPIDELISIEELDPYLERIKKMKKALNSELQER